MYIIYMYLERAVLFNFYVVIYACHEQSNLFFFFSFLKTCTNLICIMIINVITTTFLQLLLHVNLIYVMSENSSCYLFY